MARNEMVFNSLITKYNKVAFTHNYIYGFEDRGNIIACFADESVMPYVLCLDEASRGAGYSLRFIPNKSQKELLKMGKCFILCSKKYFEEVYESIPYNRGETFEKLITEYYGQVWVKDNEAFTDAPDIIADGVAYQIKYQKATFCNEKQMMGK